MRIFSLLLLFSCTDSAKIVEDIDADGFPSDLDCNDTDAAINPKAEEICNGIDDNCNGLIDTDDPDILELNEGYKDEDGDDTVAGGEDETRKWACHSKLQFRRK